MYDRPTSVHVGKRLGRYELIQPLGRGGMGEVYLAQDTIVGRNVAIKVLPENVLADESCLKRLGREARLLASLSHPNIAALYGFEEDHGVPFLVLELVSGDTLSTRLLSGAVPRREALELSVQVAAALETAHDHGIVHRDLKPSNVMITGKGHAKLLDFGVARRESVVDTGAETISHDSHTMPGQRVGTLAYMSPEQLRGLPCDQRCDIWAFGCLLYELLTGTRCFRSENSADLSAAILEREPDWSLLEGCPEKIRDLLKRCLRKDRDRRLHHIADARIELQELLEAQTVANPMSVAHTRVLMWTILGVSAIVSLAAWLALNARDSGLDKQDVRRLEFELEGTLAFDIDYPASVAISSDGELIAFVADTGREQRLYVCALDDAKARPLDGTRGAQQPFSSPDGRWLGFFADGKLKKVSVRGGAPVVLAPAPRGMGGAWSKDGWIVFAPSDFGSLRRVSDQGGEPQEFSSVKLDAGEQAHWSPVLLPDQRTVLFTVWTGGRSPDSRLALQQAGRAHRTVLEGASHGRFLPPHWLVYGRSSQLLVVQFDPARGAVIGTPFHVMQGIQDTPAVSAPIFTVSEQGTLVYAASEPSRSDGRILWLDRRGHPQQEIESGQSYYRPRLSPDNRHVVFHFADPDFNLWVKDLARGTRLRLTKDPGWDAFGVWSPDGEKIAFSSARDGSRTLFLRSADGSGAAKRLLPPGNSRWPTSWSSDGELIAFDEDNALTGLDVWFFSTSTGEAHPVIQTAFDEAWARFSPDSQWIAYHSNESGSFEVYVCSRSQPAQRYQVSTGGGTEPIWSPNGDHIYYDRGSEVVVAPIRMGKSVVSGRSEVLFTTTGEGVNDISARDDMFLSVDAPSALSINRLHVVLGWNEVVTRLATGR
jgi:serine/threonine-protein kinase